MEPRFDEIKNIPIPDEWKARALRIPTQRRRVPLIRFFAGGVAAAIAAAVGLTLWLNTRSAPPVPTETPLPVVHTTIAPTTEITTEPSEIKRTKPVDTTAAVTEPSESKMTTEITESVDVTEPSAEPTEEPSTVQENTVYTTVAATVPLTVEVQTMPTAEPKPQPTRTLPTGYFYGALTCDYIVERLPGHDKSEPVYCRIADGNSFSVTHRADVTCLSPDDPNALTVMRAVYTPSENGILLPVGNYRVTFCYANGDIISENIRFLSVNTATPNPKGELIIVER